MVKVLGSFFLVLIVAWLGIACAGAPGRNAMPTPAGVAPSPQLGSETPARETVPPREGPGETPKTFPPPRPSPTRQDVPPLSLRVLSPQDGVVVTGPTVEVRGITTPKAVVSVNGEVVDVDGQGQFVTRVALEEGPNLIQVIASNLSGEILEEDLVVIVGG